MMSGGTLSQDEINALLTAGAGGSAGGSSRGEDLSFTAQQIDYIRDLFVTFPGFMQSSAANMMSEPVTVRLEDVIASNKEKALSLFEDKILDASVSFSTGISGGHFFVANEKDLLPLAASIVGQELSSLEGAALAAFSELFHQMEQTFASSLSTTLGKDVQVGVPDTQVVEKGLSRIPSSNFLCVKYAVSFQGQEFYLYEILDALVVKSLESASSGATAPASVKAVQDDAPRPSSVPLDSSTVASSGGSPMSVYSTTPSVKGVQLPNLTPTGSSAEAQNISLLMDVSMELTVELGRTRWQVKDILGMGEGTIVELDKLAGEPVDILVNHNLIARGEVVVIDENFGVRVTEIVSSVDKVTDRRG